MQIRIGYVSQNLTLGITPSHTITVSNFNKIESQEKKLEKLIQIGKQNLENTLKILKWNVANNIYVYRLSSKLIPLATWKEFSWDYTTILGKEFRKVGNYIKEHHIRVSAHPDHFSVINTPNPEIFKASIQDLQYHNAFLTAMGLDDRYKLVVHVGGVYGDKAYGKQNFISNFLQLPSTIQRRITLENDDKSYTIEDVMELHRVLNIPIILDIHHHQVNFEKQELNLLKIFDTWKRRIFSA